MKPKQTELTKIEIIILATLGEICNKLEDILKGARRKFELNFNDFIRTDISLLWRAPEIYNQCYTKFGYTCRENLKIYINQYTERLEVNEAWESLEDVEAYWNDFVQTVAKRLDLNEEHEDNFIKYYFINTKQLYDLGKNDVVSYESVFTRLSLAILFPIYIPGTILNNLLKDLDQLQKELYVFGVDVNVILFGTAKKVKLWMKQYKVAFDNLFVDSSDEVLKARRNLNNIFSIKSMEAIGLSSKEKTKFLVPDEIDWKQQLFPGGLALVSSDGTVHYEHLSAYIGQYPTSTEIIEQVMQSFSTINDLSKDEAVKYLKDGMKYYIPPKFDRLQFEKQSGFYYDPETTLYYESKSGYFYDGQRGIYLYWCEESKCYLPVSTYTVADKSLTENAPQQSLEFAVLEDIPNQCTTVKSVKNEVQSEDLSTSYEPPLKLKKESVI